MPRCSSCETGKLPEMPHLNELGSQCSVICVSERKASSSSSLSLAPLSSESYRAPLSEGGRKGCGREGGRVKGEVSMNSDLIP